MNKLKEMMMEIKNQSKFPKIIWLIIAAVIIANLYFSSKNIAIFSWNELINNTIQTVAIITLVFITQFYAKQTQALVNQEKISLEEEKKKRYADFGEKRIDDFYNPLLVELGKLRGILDGPSINTSEVRQHKMQILEIGFKNVHMGSAKCGELRKNLDDELEDVLKKGRFRNEEREKIKEDINELAKYICDESELIGDKIKDIYGYFAYENEEEL